MSLVKQHVREPMREVAILKLEGDRIAGLREYCPAERLNT